MNIVMIAGSPHRHGATDWLASKFIEGATDAGHEVFRFDAAFKKVHPCIACEKCHTGEDGCVFKDDMLELNDRLIAADAVVFVSPIYYYDINAQVKAVIDRFYANDALLHKGKKTALLTAMADTSMTSAKGAVATFEGIAGFLEWEIAGTVIAMNSWTLDMLKESPYPQQAYDLGNSL